MSRADPSVRSGSESVARASHGPHGHVPTAAVLLILASVMCFTMLDTITKYTTRIYPVALLVWARYTVQFVAMLAWLGPRMRLDLVRTAQPRLQLLRAGLLLVSSFLFVTALRSLPLAEATAVNYSTPMVVVLLAVLLLGERMTPLRMAFMVAGIAGMVLIVRPGSELFRGASLYALGAAVCYAFYQIFTRMLSRENPYVVLFYPALVGSLVMSLALPALPWPAHVPWTHVALIVVGGLFGTFGHFLFILAFRRAPASALTPFTYMQLVFAMFVGWLVYADFPDAFTLLGMAVIAGSGLYITLHERRRLPVPDPVTID